MFGKKKTSIQKKNLMESVKRIRVIPEEFYGGKDPVIYHATTAGKANGVAKELKAQDIKKPVQGSSVSRFAGRKFMIITAAVVFVVGIAIGAVYYLRPLQTNIAPPQDNVLPLAEAPVPVVIPTTTVEVVEEVVVPTTTPVAKPTTTVGFLEFPKLQLNDSADMDSDAMTDFEEESFGTDPAIWDTDNDGYYDGQELVNLYNPRGFAPVKLIDSGLVAEYVNPVQQYRVYYPINWQVGEVDSSANQVLFSTITGDFVELSIIEMGATEDFPTWFSRMAKGEQFTDVVPFSNRFGESGYKRKDGLVAYFTYSGRVFVFIYHAGNESLASYRHVMQMMFNSFRPHKSNVEIPDQVMLPGVSNPEMVTTTSAAEINSSVETNTSTETVSAPGEQSYKQNDLVGEILG